MCEPISMGIASAASSIMAQRNAAKMQKAQQDSASAAETMRYLQQVRSMRLKEAQENEAAAQKIQAAQKKTMEHVSKQAALDKGVAGNSIQAIFQEFEAADANYRSTVHRQLEMNQQQMAFSLDSAQQGSYQAQVGINKPIAGTDFLGAAVQGVNTGMNFAANQKRING